MNVATKINNWLRTVTAHFQSSSREREEENFRVARDTAQVAKFLWIFLAFTTVHE